MTISSIELYGLTTILLISPWPIFVKNHNLTISRMVLLLFTLDIALTIEAASYSDIVLIALLHVITIPALFCLIYLDLIKQHSSYFRCFICSLKLNPEEKVELIKRTEYGKEIQVLVHSDCIHLRPGEKKSISQRIFKNGIPK